MDGMMELLTGRERRRRWSVTDKLWIVAETQEPGARISGVAARHGVCESLVFAWRVPSFRESPASNIPGWSYLWTVPCDAIVRDRTARRLVALAV
jgi:hypothetical protein